MGQSVSPNRCCPANTNLEKQEKKYPPPSQRGLADRSGRAGSDKILMQLAFCQLSKGLTYRLEESVSVSLCWAPETAGRKHWYFFLPHGKTSMAKGREKSKHIYLIFYISHRLLRNGDPKKQENKWILFFVFKESGQKSDWRYDLMAVS